jgi:phage terminase large subunit-like protein
MLQIDREKIASLPATERAQALELLETYEKALKDNPLLGYRPHPKQHEFHASSARKKAFLGGNRSGKTTAGILDGLIQCVDRDCLPDHLLQYKKWDPPFYGRIVVPSFDLLQAVAFQKIREWCPKDQFAGGGFDKAFEKTNRVLRFKNGSWFDFKTFDQDVDKHSGAALHRVHFDEEPPRAIRNENMMRLIDYGGDELFTMTPVLGMSWMYDVIWDPWTKGALENAIVVVVDMDDNPYLSTETKREALEGLSKAEREARKSGRFVHFAGMIYDEFSRMTHVIPEVEQVPANAEVYVGIDPGMRHMAAVVWAYLTADGTMVVFDELALQGYTVKRVAESIKQINMRWGQRTGSGAVVPLQPRWYVIDPSARNIMHQTGRSDQMEFTDHGIVTILAQNSVTAGINRVKERLQAHRLAVTANCPVLIDQFRKYRWAAPNRGEDDPKEKPVKTDDHLLDALRYVVASKPYANPDEEEQYLDPVEARMREEISGKTFKRRQIPATPMGGIYA